MKFVLPFLVFPLLFNTVLGQPASGTILWTYYGAGNSSPALGADGTIYVGRGDGLLAITNSGPVASNKWTFPVGLAGSPAIGADGTIYFVGYNGSLYAINSDGTLKWSYSGAGGGGGTPAIGFDGAIYFHGYTGLHAISPSGDKKWNAAGGASSFFSSPVVGPDATVYLGVVQYQHLYAFHADGTQKWAQDLPFSDDSPAIGTDGNLYFTARALRAISPDGTNLWTTGFDENGPNGPPVISGNGTLYVSGNTGHELHAIVPGGQELWQTFGSGSRSAGTAAAVDAGGTIYYCLGNIIMALNPNGQFVWGITNGLPFGPNTSPIIGPDGTLYATLGPTLFAIATGTNGPADSPWPMYHGNARHTGKIEKPAIKKPQRRSDANFQFELYAQLGQTNTVETTTNLSTWTSLTSVVVSTVPMDVVDLTASNFPSRFYRALAP